MYELTGDKVPKLFFNKEVGYYELFSSNGEEIGPLINVDVTSNIPDFLSASIKLFVNIVNERPKQSQPWTQEEIDLMTKKANDTFRLTQ